MGNEIHKSPDLMRAIAVIEEHEENKFSDIPQWTGWIKNYTDNAVLLEMERGPDRRNWFPYSQLRRTEDGKSLYASDWLIDKKGL